MLTRCAVKVPRSFAALFCGFPRVANLVTIARRTRNTPHVTNVAPVRRAICFIVCFSLILSSQPVVSAGVGKSAEKPNVHLTQGPPSRNLPNLDNARGIEPETPKIMPPVPATKCRGRDEKCKKAKEKISNNLSNDQHGLQAYAGPQSRRDYVDWFSAGISPLSVLADLIYWPASMISNFPDVPYRDSGSVLTESAVKLTNPRNGSYGNAASGEPQKEYSRIGRSIVTITPQSVSSVHPGANQTPDPGQSGTLAVSGILNTGHGDTGVNVSAEDVQSNPSQNITQSMSARWSSF